MTVPYNLYQQPIKAIVKCDFNSEIRLDLDNYMIVQKKEKDEVLVLASFINEENKMVFVVEDMDAVDSYIVPSNYIEKI